MQCCIKVRVKLQFIVHTKKASPHASCSSEIVPVSFLHCAEHCFCGSATGGGGGVGGMEGVATQRCAWGRMVVSRHQIIAAFLSLHCCETSRLLFLVPVEVLTQRFNTTHSSLPALLHCMNFFPCSSSTATTATAAATGLPSVGIASATHAVGQDKGYALTELLGEGRYGRVYRGESDPAGATQHSVMRSCRMRFSTHWAAAWWAAPG